MNVGDLINGLFETSGALFVLLHIRAILKDKTVKGVSIPAMIYFTSWGWWNVYFYPANGLIYSFVGGILLALTNIVHVSLTIYYFKKSAR